MFHRLIGKYLGVISLLLAPCEFWLLLISDFPNKYRTFSKWLIVQKLFCVNNLFYFWETGIFGKFQAEGASGTSLQ